MGKKPLEVKNQTSYLRPPIVAVLGHVDHGKTTLLDKIRQTRVAEKETGLITQRIGAYQAEVEVSGEKKKITFIDTPGHEIFAKMRQRGAQITDIAILVVAQDDGVMPQTKESLTYLKETKTPFIVALNKSDLATANPEKVKKQLAEEEVLLEGMGGEVVALSLSAKTGAGVKELLEMILLLAEMEGLKADPDGPLELTVIESRLDPRRGPVATVIVRSGTLHQGETIKLGEVTSKVRGMINEQGQRVFEAGPSTPVEILGLSSVPAVGEVILERLPPKERIEETEGKQLKIILKADNTGSLEAILGKLPSGVEIISCGVGEITESEVLLAKTSGAIILGFNLKSSVSVKKLAETEGVLLKAYNLVYELLTELKEAVLALEKPQSEEEVLGRAKIVAQFPFSKEKVAGCQVIEGRLARNDLVKVIRGNQEVGRAKIKSLRRLKEDIPKAEMGTECGVLLSPSLDFQTGDMLLSYKLFKSVA